LELLTEAGVMPERPRALLEAADADPQLTRLTRLRRLMAYVRDTDETALLARSHELAFLANTLLAGCSVQSRPFTPQEAADAAAGICNLGLEYWPARWPSLTSPGASSPPPHDPATAAPPATCPPDSLLIDRDLVTAFEVGWSVLYQDVSLFAAEQLISTLTDLIKGAALDIPIAPLISRQRLLPRSARLARYADKQRVENSRLGPHNGRIAERATVQSASVGDFFYRSASEFSSLEASRQVRRAHDRFHFARGSLL
jgi:hypothetical protein